MGTSSECAFFIFPKTRRKKCFSVPAATKNLKIRPTSALNAEEKLHRSQNTNTDSVDFFPMPGKIII